MQSNEWQYVAVCVGVAFKLNSAAKHKCARYRITDRTYLVLRSGSYFSTISLYISALFNVRCVYTHFNSPP